MREVSKTGPDWVLFKLRMKDVKDLEKEIFLRKDRAFHGTKQVTGMKLN